MIDSSRPVRVYWNFKHRCYSLFQAGAVVGSAAEVMLDGARFVVRESGRRRMLEDGRKRIHAYVEGRLVDWTHADESRSLTAPEGEAVIYDPLRFASFVERHSGRAVHAAERVHFGAAGMTAVAPRPEPEIAAAA
jgi:hypothetical protein